MKIFTSKQIKEIENYTIVNEPISSIDLMEEAAISLLDPILEKIETEDEFQFYIVCGPGNNGGDGLALARLYQELGFKVITVFCDFSTNISPECKINLNKLKKIKTHKLFSITKAEELPDFEDSIIIDCIFGKGLNRKITGEYAKLIEKINNVDNTVISVDIPSGLFGEDNSDNDGAIIRANYTFSFNYRPLAALFTENQKYFGELELVELLFLKEIEKKIKSPYYVLINEMFKSILVERERFVHKGNFGHALLIAGSYGKAGAAVLAAKACMRTGIGLLTLHVPEKLVDILQISVPEAMLTIDENDKYVSKIEDLEKYNVIGIGPGLAVNDITENAFANFLKTNTKPIVIDADGLNIIAKNKELLKFLKPGTILTPHPKEFERLFGKFNSEFNEIEFMREFSKNTGVIIVKKSAITTISSPEAKVYFNTLGNPGMATAGSGDVLTGIITSLLAQNYSAINAALLGVYLHALAGDFVSFKIGVEALIASDIVEKLKKCFDFIRNANSFLPEMFDKLSQHEYGEDEDYEDFFNEDHWEDEDEEDDEIYLKIGRAHV